GRGRKIINLSEGDQEIAMLRAIRDSGWKGPVGILNHRDHLDAEVGLRDNLIGLQWVLRELAQTGSGGEKPKLESVPASR
ncbi:MAG: signal peptide protein, partial [Chthoniobacter sp.]|nr:signal peptide protein [Chthoniobacter sp.]